MQFSPSGLVPVSAIKSIKNVLSKTFKHQFKRTHTTFHICTVFIFFKYAGMQTYIICSVYDMQ